MTYCSTRMIFLANEHELLLIIVIVNNEAITVLTDYRWYLMWNFWKYRHIWIQNYLTIHANLLKLLNKINCWTTKAIQWIWIKPPLKWLYPRKLLQFAVECDNVNVNVSKSNECMIIYTRLLCMESKWKTNISWLYTSCTCMLEHSCTNTCMYVYNVVLNEMSNWKRRHAMIIASHRSYSHILTFTRQLYHLLSNAWIF